MDCIWVNLTNGTPFFKFTVCLVNTCIKMSFKQLENHSQLLCGHDVVNERLWVRQFDIRSSQLANLNKIT